MRVWEEFLRELEKELGAPTIDQWLRTLKVARFDAGNLYLEALDPVQISWFDEHVRPRLRGRFVNNNQRPIRIHLSTPSSKTHSEESRPAAHPFAIASDRIDPEFTFENFLPSPQNALGHKILSEIDRPGEAVYNPIYLFGPKGCGKTHLLTASAIALQKKGRNVFFVHAQTFTSHVVQAIRLGHMQQLRKTYREIDALLVDDIDVFARKDATQEEFFHTFNALHTLGKQLILSASVSPAQLTAIEPRLISRFEWGVSIGLDKGNIPEILAKKAELWKLSFSPEVIQFLSEKFPLDPLLAMQALSLRTKGLTSLTTEKAQFLLQDYLSREEEKALSPEKIVKTIAAHYGLKSEDLLGKSQLRGIALPRQVAMYLCRERLKLPFQKIGEIFGRDHSTVMASVRQIQKGVEENNNDLLAVLREVKS